jgi:hypothetical protein
MLDGVRRWSTEGGVNVVVPLTGIWFARHESKRLVLEEIDKLKRGAEPVNVKARLAIRYLDGKTKARNRLSRSADGHGPRGSLRIQTSEEIFTSWEECEKLVTVTQTESLERRDIPRHFRGMINCVLYQRSIGTETSIVTDDLDLISFGERWGITTMNGNELDAECTQALENYRNDMKVYETRARSAARHSPPQGRALWSPPKK